MARHGQLRARGLYPTIVAPSFNQHGGEVTAPFDLTMSTSGGAIYYTLDGSDPRIPPTPVLESVLLAEGAPAKAFVPGDAADFDVWRLKDYDDGSWQSGTTGVGAEALPDNYADLMGLPVVGALGQNASIYVRVPFTVSDAATLDAISALRLDLKYEDGFVAYINGVEVASAGDPTPLVWNSDAEGSRSDSLAVEFEEFDVTAAIPELLVGENVLAIHLLNSSASNSDVFVSPQLVALDGSPSGIAPGAVLYGGAPVEIDAPAVASARTLENGEWSALNRARFLVDTEPASAANLAVSEIQYRPGDAGGGEWIEIANIGSAPVDIAGIRFIDGIRFDFAIDSALVLDVLLPGERAVVVGNPEAFLAANPGLEHLVAGEFVGDLENDGEQIILQAGDGSIIRDFVYNDRHPWPEAADGEGFTLTLIAPESDPNHSLASHWRPSASAGGSPGASDAVPFPGGDADALLAFATGGGPLSISLIDDGRPVVSVPFRVAADDVTFAIESSIDLLTWRAAGDALQSAPGDLPEGGFQQLPFVGSAPVVGDAPRYYRVRVQLRP